MTVSRPGVTVPDWLLTLAAIAALGLAFALTQTMMPGGAGHDGAFYLLMAEQIQQGLRPETVTPFVLRVGTPWLASVVAAVGGLSLLGAFLLINLLAGAVAALLFVVWLRPHVPDAMTRVVLVVFFLVSPYSPFRFTYYYPVLTDSIAMLFLVAALIVLDRLSNRIDATGSIALLAIVAVGCVFRELVVVAAIAAVFIRPWRLSPLEWLWRLLPLTGILALGAIQSWVIVTPSAYSMDGAIERWLTSKPPSMMALAVLFVFGPLLVLLVQRWRATWHEAATRPDLLAFAGVFAGAAWLGASDTERILMFAAPVVLMQIGKRLAGVRLSGAHTAFAEVVVCQLLAYRVFVAIEGSFLPFFSEYFSLFTVWLDPVGRYMFLALYAVLMALTFVIVRDVVRIPPASDRVHV